MLTNDADTINVTAGGEAKVPLQLLSLAKTRVEPTIADFMSKPYLVRTGSMSPSNVAGTYLSSFSISPSIYANSVWLDKLRGFSLWRGTAVIRLQVNASPFHAGMLRLHFIPQYTKYIREFSSHNANLQTRTQQPGVEFDIQDTEVTFRVPYISPTAYFDVASGGEDWGSFFCTVYSPLATGALSPQTVDFSIWLSFEDFEVDGPSAQSYVRKGQKGTSKAYMIRQPSEREARPVSTILGQASKIAASAMSIPNLAPFAGPTSWFLNAASGAAAAFGWSKPLDDNSHMRMLNEPHMFSANANSFDLSAPLALLADNKLGFLPNMSGSNEDEMSVAFLKSRFAYIETIKWLDTSSGLLWTKSLHPRMGDTSYPAVPGSYTCTPLSFLSRIFDAWRGGIRLKFTVVKTPFHSGRLMVTFDPAGNVPTVHASAYLYRTVIDIREGSVFCLDFPYMKNVNYSFCDPSRGPVLGSVNIFVINELRAPPTVSADVEILVEACGSPDMEFQIPSLINHGPILPQGADEDPVKELVCDYIGGANPNVGSTESSLYCIGETILSLLQILKRYNLVHTRIAFASSGCWTPYSLGALRTATPMVNPEVGGDPLSLFSAMYAYSRGGMRVKLVTTPSSGLMRVGYYQNPTAQVADTTPIQIKNRVDFLSGGNGLGTNMNSLHHGVGFSVQIPQQTRMPFMVNEFDTVQAPPAGGTRPKAMLEWNCTSTMLPETTFLYRAVADDFNMSYFLSTPIMGSFV